MDNKRGYNPEKPQSGEPKGFQPEQELVRIVKMHDPLAAVQIEHQIESGEDYERIVRDYENRLGALREYHRRSAAKSDPAIQQQLEARDREEFESVGRADRVADWYAFNDEYMGDLESIIKDYGADPKDPVSLERLAEQTMMVIEACGLVDSADAAGREVELHLPRVAWDGQDENVVRDLNAITNKNPVAVDAASEWQRMRQNGYHPFEAKRRILETLVPQKLQDEYGSTLPREGRDQLIIQVNHLMDRAQSYRHMVGDCRWLAKDNPFAAAILKDLEPFTPEQQADYRLVHERSLAALERVHAELAAQKHLDEQVLKGERYVRDIINQYKKDDTARSGVAVMPNRNSGLKYSRVGR